MKTEIERRKAEGGRLKRVVAWFIPHPSSFILHPSSFIPHPSFFILPLFVLWSATHLDGFSWDYDEGVHVVIAWLAQQGHPLYAQTFSPYTPGFIVPLAAAFDLFGATMFTARIVTVVFAALGVLGVMLIARELTTPLSQVGRGGGGEGVLSGLVAAALLILTPSFLQWSRAALSDLPAAAVTALAVGLALVYMRERKLRWLFASEIVFAFALWVKLIAVGGAAALALAALFVLRERRADAQRALAGSLLVGALAALPLLFFDVRGLYEQAIYFHIQKRAAFGFSLSDNLQILANFLGNNLTLVTLAALGAFITLAVRESHQRRAVFVVVGWFAAVFVSLAYQAPLFANHHPVVLVFALAALAGAGVGFANCELRIAICDLRQRSGLLAGFAISSLAIRRLPSAVLRQLVTLSLVVLALVGLTQYPDQLAAAGAPPFQPVAGEAVALLQAVTPPTDRLVSDAQFIAFRAQRQAPPALTDTSTARLLSGNLTASQLISLTQQSNANAVLFWSGRLASAAPFVEWVERNYHGVRSSFQKRTSDYRLLLREPHPQVPLDAQMGEGIRLLGYDLNRRADTPIVVGQPLSLTLYFQRTGIIEKSYTVFAHLLGADGQVVAQADRLPLAGAYLTNQWQANELVVDEFVMPLEVELADGDYPVEVGMYQRETLQRLPITVAGARQPDDRVLLPKVTIRTTR